MIPGSETDRVLLAHMGECIERIREYTAGDRSRFEASRLVQDAEIRIVEQDLPPLAAALARMIARTCDES